MRLSSSGHYVSKVDIDSKYGIYVSHMVPTLEYAGITLFREWEVAQQVAHAIKGEAVQLEYKEVVTTTTKLVEKLSIFNGDFHC